MRPFPFGGPGRPHRGPSSTATHPEPRSDTRRGWGVITLPTDACGFLPLRPVTPSPRQAIHRRPSPGCVARRNLYTATGQSDV